MSGCRICPRSCGADRRRAAGYCGAGPLPHVARAALHHWEEPYLSGSRGSGAIFFCGCNLSCLFCQNHEISHGAVGEAAGPERLAGLMLALEAEGAHNINLVTPAPHVPALIPALRRARREGLKIPIVYNTNAYEKVVTLRALEGLVEIYLPDLKYASSAVALRYSDAEDYPEAAFPALLEMKRQVGDLRLDGEGIARSGMAVRHLVLPGSIDETRRVLDFIAGRLGRETWISLMGQYVPCHNASFPPLNRRLTRREYDRAVDYCLELGLKNVLIQELSAASSAYTPAFDGSLPENVNKL